MPHRRILVASPIEPSGASWLLNCFLELGIRIDHKPVVDRVFRGSAPLSDPSRMWIRKGDRQMVLEPRAGVLRKFLPALARRMEFQFREDLSVEYVQDFPRRRLDATLPFHGPPVLMVRDPRDALYSSYRRSAPALDFGSFLEFLNPQTLLGRPAHWALFIASWLSQSDVHVVRFEDYKLDAEATLRSVLMALQLPFPEHDIAEAVRLSSFEEARNAELALREQFPNDRQVANRSGTVGEGRGQVDVQASAAAIEGKAGAVLRKLGYETRAAEADDPFAQARLCRAFLAFFETIHLPDAIGPEPGVTGSAEIMSGIFAFAHRLDSGLLTQANMPPAEAQLLLDTLAEFTARHAEWLATRLSSTRVAVSDGSGYFFRRIREMRHVAAGGHL